MYKNTYAIYAKQGKLNKHYVNKVDRWCREVKKKENVRMQWCWWLSTVHTCTRCCWFDNWHVWSVDRTVVVECWTYMGCWDPLMLTLWHLPRVCFSTTGVCSTVYFSPYNIVRDGGQGGIEVLKWCYILYIAVWCLGSRLQLTFSHHFVLNSSAQRHIIKVMSMMTA